jgi:hypothetical protein
MRGVPIEVRHLIFEEAEVGEALIGYDRRTRPQSRSMTVADLRLDDFPTMKGYLTLRTAEGGLDVVEFSAAQLAAALILYCRHTGIPLPARASKTVKILDRGLRLSLSLNAPPSLQSALTPHGSDFAAAAR